MCYVRCVYMLCLQENQLINTSGFDHFENVHNKPTDTRKPNKANLAADATLCALCVQHWVAVHRSSSSSCRSYSYSYALRSVLATCALYAAYLHTRYAA